MALTFGENTLGALGVIAVGANLIGVWFYGYPVVYCAASPYFLHGYKALGIIALYATAVYCAYSMVQGRVLQTLTAAITFMAIVELPNLAGYLLTMGGSCG